MSEEKYQFNVPSSSAVYKAIENMIFNRKTLAHRIVKILPDENDRRIRINNPSRMKHLLFETIMSIYNRRIIRYDLNYHKLSKKDEDKLAMIQYNFIKSSDEHGYSARYEVFPKTFVCSKCKQLRVFISEKASYYWSRFDQTKCRRDNCGGSYEQISLLLFCEDCGLIKPINYYCGEHHSQDIRLSWKEKDSLISWKVVCNLCFEAGKKDKVDIFRLTCNHKIGNLETLKQQTTKYKALTIKEGGVYTPFVLTTVDVPELGEIDFDEEELVYLAFYLKKFKNNDFNLDEKYELLIDDIKEFIDDYHQKRKRERFIEKKVEKGHSTNETEKMWKEEVHFDLIEKITRELKVEYGDVDITNFIEYLSLKGSFLSKSSAGSISTSYVDFLESLENEDRKIIRRTEYEAIKTEFGINEIFYLPEIKLISSCIGLINGVNKFYETDFVPHFDPIWYDVVKRDEFKSYIYPFITEGILIELDKVRICMWLRDNKFVELDDEIDESKAREILLKINKDSRAFLELKTLLHTFSHILISRSKNYTGLDSESCGEMLFISSASILIYSTSSINIGGFQYVFEHSIRDWFRDILFDVQECTFDPTCLFEMGSCFSCLHLPEFVCTDFNKNLDRDSILGKGDRYKKGFW